MNTNINAICLSVCNNNTRNAYVVKQAVELVVNNSYTIAEAMDAVGMTVNEKSLDIMDYVINECSTFATDISQNNDEAWGGRWAR